MPTAKHWSTVASTVNTTLFPPSDEWHFACTQSSRVHQAKQEGVAACHKPCNLQWSDKLLKLVFPSMILIYLRCQRPRLFISAADSDASDRTRRTCCTRKTTSGTQGNLGSISAVSRVQSSMPPEKSSFERMSGGSFSKQRLLIEPIRGKRGQLRVIFSLNGTKLLSSLQARWVFLWGQNPSPALDKSVLTVVLSWRYWYQFTFLHSAAFGLSISPAQGHL